MSKWIKVPSKWLMVGSKDGKHFEVMEVEMRDIDEGIENHIKTVPSADVVEVVRCKDCMYVHANKNNRQLTCNRRMLGAVRSNDYCSLGAYKDGEEQEHE